MKCKKCGAEMEWYKILDITLLSDFTLGGTVVYACTNPDCEDYKPSEGVDISKPVYSGNFFKEDMNEFLETLE